MTQVIPVKKLSKEKFERHIKTVNEVIFKRLKEAKHDPKGCITVEEFHALQKYTQELFLGETIIDEDISKYRIYYTFGKSTKEESDKISLEVKKILKDLGNNDVDADKKYYLYYANIINYQSFSSRKNGKHRHDLMMDYGLKTCPYCNRQYITSWETRSTADCDHIFPKAKYPLLALSYHNLIPSCQVCNSRMKGEREGHLNPFELADDKRLMFDISIEPEELYLDCNKDFNIEIKQSSLWGKESEEEEAHLEIFNLASLYQIHKSEITYMYKRLRYYEKSYLNQLSKEFPLLTGTAKNKITKKWNDLNVEFSNQYEENLDKPLAKLIQDTHGKLLEFLAEIDEL